MKITFRYISMYSTFAFIYIYFHCCIHTHVHIFLFTFKRKHIFLTYVHAHTHTYIYTYIPHVYIYIYFIYARIYIYIYHLCIYIYTHILMFRRLTSTCQGMFHCTFSNNWPKFATLAENGARAKEHKAQRTKGAKQHQLPKGGATC